MKEGKDPAFNFSSAKVDSQTSGQDLIFSFYHFSSQDLFVSFSIFPTSAQLHAQSWGYYCSPASSLALQGTRNEFSFLDLRSFLSAVILRTQSLCLQVKIPTRVLVHCDLKMQSFYLQLEISFCVLGRCDLRTLSWFWQTECLLVFLSTVISECRVFTCKIWMERSMYVLGLALLL